LFFDVEDSAKNLLQFDEGTGFYFGLFWILSLDFCLLSDLVYFTLTYCLIYTSISGSGYVPSSNLTIDSFLIFFSYTLASILFF
jgi:hypothetical protein